MGVETTRLIEGLAAAAAAAAGRMRRRKVVGGFRRRLVARVSAAFRPRRLGTRLVQRRHQQIVAAATCAVLLTSEKDRRRGVACTGQRSRNRASVLQPRSREVAGLFGTGYFYCLILYNINKRRLMKHWNMSCQRCLGGSI